MAALTPKEISLKYFTLISGETHQYKCKCDAVITQGKNTGWSNLFSHVNVSHLCSKPLIGCVSHRFNIAVRAFLVPYEELIIKVNTPMGKLKNLKLAGKLRSFTELRAKQKNETRWSSTADMLKRYNEIQEYLLKSDFTTDNSIVSYLLSPEDNNKIEVLLKGMKYMDSITKALQSEKTDLSDVRVLFDNVIKKYPSLTTYLGAEAEIVHNPSFESALVKIQDRKFEALTDAEQTAAKCLKVQDTVQTSPADDDQEYGDSEELMLKKRKMEKFATQEKCAFKDSRFLLPTSNIIERFFSERVMLLTTIVRT